MHHGKLSSGINAGLSNANYQFTIYRKTRINAQTIGLTIGSSRDLCLGWY